MHVSFPTTALAALVTLSPLSAQTPSQSSTGAFADDGWGRCVAVVGDVDDDGFDDWAVGSPDADRFVTSPFPILWPDTGRVVVHSGRTGAALHTWYGPTAGGSEFGHAVCGAGDVDGDGHADVLVGAPRGDSGVTRSGFVRLYSGADGTLLRTLFGAQTDARYGHAIAGGRDANGDGVPDLLVGSPHEDLDDAFGGPGEEGNARLVSLANGALLWVHDDPLWTAVKPCPSLFCRDVVFVQGYGTAVAMLGDRDGDGALEIAVGGPDSDYESQRKTSLLGPWEVVSSSDDVGCLRVVEPFGDLDAMRFTTAFGKQRGTAVVALGGLLPTNGLALAVGGTGGNGYVEVLGEFGLPDSLELFRTFDGTADAPIGTAIGALGDVDDDGVPDLAIGAPTADHGSPFALLSAGEVSVRSTWSGALLDTFGGSQGFASFGASIAGGDVDGDSAPDLIVGAPGIDTSSVDAGAAYVFPGHGCVAGSTLYGHGLAGTLGVPVIGAVGAPAIGASFGLTLGNSLGAPTIAWIPLGLASASQPLKGGTLLVAPFTSFVLPLPAGTTTFTFPIPDDDTLCGVSVFLQALEADPGASHGASFTRGLRLDLGY